MPNIYINDNCHECNPCAQPTVTVVNTGCPVQIDFECTIYNKNGDVASLLTNLDLPNGTDGKTILEAIDAKLGDLLPYVFPEYVASCINYDGYHITNMTEFLTSVDNEFCDVKASFNNLSVTTQTQINNLTTTINTINHPNFADDCGLNILTTDTIAEVLVKLKDGYCLLVNNTFSDNSPIFSPIQSNSVTWLTGGVKNHSPIANVRKSAFAGNNLQILSDGLYVGDILPTTQVISYNPITRVVSLSGGGGSFVLPPDEDEQNLSLDSITNILTITGGNSVDLSPILPSFSQTPITPNITNSITLSASGTANTSITADLNISATAGNTAVVNSDGLYVPGGTVKADSSGSADYLRYKIEGDIVDSITTTATYNVISDKVKISTSVDLGDLVNDIGGNPTSLTALQTIILNTICFRFKITNTHVTDTKTYSYKDCSNNTLTGLTLAAGASIILFGKGAFSSDAEINIYNLGFNF